MRVKLLSGLISTSHKFRKKSRIWKLFCLCGEESKKKKDKKKKIPGYNL